MIRTSTGFIALGILALSVSFASAQPPAGGQAPPPLKNLQVIPKDTPRRQVIQPCRGSRKAWVCGASTAMSTNRATPTLRRMRSARKWSPLEKILEIDPQNAQARRQLDQLKK